ncbi:MAG: preprotein translocase subunit SecE [Culicoidibacterales bacterium]
MAIKRERQTTKTVVLDDKPVKIEEKKSTAKKEKATVSKKKERFLSPKALKEEYSKITWSSPKRIARETVWIVFFLVLVATFIALADLGIYHIVTSITKTNAAFDDMKAGLIGLGVSVVVIALIFYFLRERSTKKKAA